VAKGNGAAALEDDEELAGLIRALTMWRVSWKISQATVADRMGTVQSAVSELEGGSAQPRVSTLQRYARAIGCRVVLRFEPAVEDPTES
jgi:transcriptional regulator with XRE-family HTH domain